MARDLNNLAQLLQATNRLAEAEPLKRRTLEILLAVTRDTRHQHPHLTAVVSNYGDLLVAMGNTQAEAEEKIRAMRAQCEVSI